MKKHLTPGCFWRKMNGGVKKKIIKIIKYFNFLDGKV